jgi:hypothetical protein
MYMDIEYMTPAADRRHFDTILQDFLVFCEQYLGERLVMNHLAITDGTRPKDGQVKNSFHSCTPPGSFEAV